MFIRQLLCARSEPETNMDIHKPDNSRAKKIKRGIYADLLLLFVDDTIKLENLHDILFVGRPGRGQPDSTVDLFKLIGDGSEAVHVNVKLGRASVNSVEVLQGLSARDIVIVSDMSNWDSSERIRLR